jgi:hypothetical protein
MYAVPDTFHSVIYCFEKSVSWESDKLAATQKNSNHFMETESSLKQPQVPAPNSPYSEPAGYSLVPHMSIPEDPS